MKPKLVSNDGGMVIHRPPLTAYTPGRMGEWSIVETHARWQMVQMEKAMGKGEKPVLRLVGPEDDGDEV